MIEKELSSFATKNELEQAICERKKETGSIRDIIKLDGGLVHKKDLDDFHKKNSTQNEKIIKMISRLSPLLSLADEKTVKYIKDGVELKRSTDNVITTWKGRAKTIAVFLGLVALAITIINGIKDLIFEWMLRVK